ncbi:MAG: DUF2892 domain-containing protein [Acidobacteria bacterium]|nr:DUF2892 domain-containing protein [Acidobacteriota bacterium]
MFREIDVIELRAALDKGATLIDVREFAEYAAGRVPGARLIPLGSLATRATEIDRDKPVFLMCRTGRRSSEAQRILGELGFAHTVNVQGGFGAWQAAGFEVTRDPKAPWALERQVRFVAGLLVLTGVLLSVLVWQPFIWMAGFIGGGLVFAAVTDTCTMGLLLSKMPWNAVGPPSCKT